MNLNPIAFGKLRLRSVSIRRKQMLAIMLTSTVSLLVACAGFVAYELSRVRPEILASMSSLAEVVGNNTTAAIDFNDPSAATQTLAALRGEQDVVLARIHTLDGREFATYAREGTPRPPEMPHSATEQHEFTGLHLYLFRPIMEGGEQIATIELVADMRQLRERVSRYAGIVGLVLAVSLLAALWLSNLLQKLVSEPILHLARVARSVAQEKNYSARAAKQSNDELGQLVDGFNEMLGQIQVRDIALQSAHAKLEMRVEARTAELARANEALQTENAERKQAQATLHESQERFLLLAKATNDAVWDWNFVTDAVWWNEGFEVLFGYRRDQVDPTSKSWTGHIHPDDLARVTGSIHRAIKGGVDSWSNEYRFQRQNGLYAYVLDRGHIIHDAEGKAIRMVGGMTDQTERKSAEEALQRQRTELRVLFDLMPALIWFKDTNNVILRVNQRVADAAGKPIEEIEGKSFMEVYPQNAARFYADDLDVIRSGESKLGCIETVLDSSGQERWIQTDKVPYSGRNGQAIGIVVMAQDITDRKRVEMRQRAEEERYLRQRNALINFTGGGPSGGEDLTGMIRRLTETSAATLGVARVSIWRYNDDHSAIHCLDLYEETANRHTSGIELAAADYPDYFRALAARSVIAVEGVQLDEGASDFSKKYLQPLGITSVLYAPIELGGLAEGVLCHEHIGPPRRWTTDEETFAVAVANVASLALEGSERRRAQAELENTHKQLVEASRRGGMAEIATNVLHNVGNVLNSVNISTSVILESVQRSRVSRLGRVVELLREHADGLGKFLTHDSKGKQLPDYLAQLSDHLLTEQASLTAELGSLRQNVEHIKEIVTMQQSYATVGGVKEVVSVVDLVEDSIRMNEGALTRHRVMIRREFETVPPLNVEKHKILQILVNLVRNAKYACVESDREDKEMEVRVTNGSGRVLISIVDNGVGILRENLTRIFNHGFTTRKGGHGFGLHSGALAAREMGGSLTAKSDGPAKGAAFTLELPAPPEPVAGSRFHPHS